MQAELERSFEVDYARRPPIFLPYLDGGSAPGEETPPTAALVGLRAADSPTDMLRAVIQGVAFGLRDIFESLGPTATPITQVQLAGPLATHDSWCQLMADVLGIPTARTQIADTTELGAAMIGAVGVGMWDSIDSAANGMLRLSSEFQPRGEAVEFHADTFRRFQSIRSALGLGASRRLGQDVRIGPTREVP